MPLRLFDVDRAKAFALEMGATLPAQAMELVFQPDEMIPAFE